MTQDNKYERGIGVIAAIAIVAVLAVGGFATYRVVQNSQVQVEVEEQEQMDESEKTVAEVRADVVSTLLDVRADLVLSAQASVDTAVLALTDLSARIDEAVLAVEGQARAELVVLKTEIQELRAQIEAKSETVSADIESFVDEVEADIQAELGADIMIDGDSTTEDEDSVENGDDSVGVDAEANATVESSY